MRVSALATVLACVPLTPAAGADDPDAKALVGTWTITKGEKGGATQDKADSKGEFRFRDGAVRVASGEQEAEYSYELRPSKKPGERPSEIDFRTNAPKGAGGVVLGGIYRLDGDDLVIALSLAPFPRPTEFKTDKDTTVIVFTLKRKK
jgi:uncharacterized protein (TIGR03067 family)